MNFLRQGFQKSEHYRQTDTQTDATENNYHTAFESFNRVRRGRMYVVHRTATGALVSKTRSSAIRRESAHLTWLYCTVQMAFQYETVWAWITSVTDRQRT